MATPGALGFDLQNVSLLLNCSILLLDFLLSYFSLLLYWLSTETTTLSAQRTVQQTFLGKEPCFDTEPANCPDLEDVLPIQAMASSLHHRSHLHCHPSLVLC